MCLCIFSYQNHPNYHLVLAFNRDEFLGRPTKPAHFWEDHPSVLAGRDGLQGGTWLGINKDGRFAFLTNYRCPEQMSDAPSRGALTVNFLISKESSEEYLENLVHPERYNGFNLLTGDQNELYWYSNILDQLKKVEPGLHGISNEFLNTPWPKVSKKLKEFDLLLKKSYPDPETIFRMMLDREVYPAELLPDTGVGAELEKKFSAPFIILEDYGTVSTTLIFIDKSGKVHYYETRYGKGGKVLDKAIFSFKIC